MHRRIEDIRKFYDVQMADLQICGLSPRREMYPRTLMERANRADLDDRALDAYMADWKPSLTILDFF